MSMYCNRSSSCRCSQHWEAATWIHCAVDPLSVDPLGSRIGQWIHCQAHVKHWRRRTLIPFLLRRAPRLDVPAITCSILRSQISRLSVEDMDVTLCGQSKKMGAKRNCRELVFTLCRPGVFLHCTLYIKYYYCLLEF